MKDNSIKTLNSKSLTPEVVLHNCLQGADNFKAVYIVAITKSGPTELWMSSKLDYLPIAQLLLQDLSLKMLKGNVEQERP
jgi:hypothetical protein